MDEWVGEWVSEGECECVDYLMQIVWERSSHGSVAPPPPADTLPAMKEGGREVEGGTHSHRARECCIHSHQLWPL